MSGRVDFTFHENFKEKQFLELYAESTQIGPLIETRISTKIDFINETGKLLLVGGRRHDTDILRLLDESLGMIASLHLLSLIMTNTHRIAAELL